MKKLDLSSYSRSLAETYQTSDFRFGNKNGQVPVILVTVTFSLVSAYLISRIFDSEGLKANFSIELGSLQYNPLSKDSRFILSNIAKNHRIGFSGTNIAPGENFYKELVDYVITEASSYTKTPNEIIQNFHFGESELRQLIISECGGEESVTLFGENDMDALFTGFEAFVKPSKTPVLIFHPELWLDLNPETSLLKSWIRQNDVQLQEINREIMLSFRNSLNLADILT
jgi:hypothetical protein